MNEVQEKLIELVGQTLFNKNTDVVLTQDIEREAELQTVLGLIDSRAYAVFTNSYRVIDAHAILSDVLKEIPFVTIKGFASAYYYPEPIRRTMGDVDFLIDPNDFVNANKQLIEAGFTREKDSDTHLHYVYKKSGIIYEMHTELNGIPEDNGYIKRVVSETVKSATSVNVEDGTIIIPNDFYNGYICLLHILSHLRNGGIGLRHFCDWACFVNKIENFEVLFHESFEQAGLWKCAQVFSLAAVKYLGLQYHSWMGLADDDMLSKLMDEIISSGNFGCKVKVPEAQWFVDMNYTDSKMKGLYNSINQAIRANWPIAKQVSLVYLVGWIVIPLRYLFRVLFGRRRNLNFKEAMKQAERKNRILKYLELFRAD